MGQEYLFENLPSEIIRNILSRLDVRTIAMSKCVRKSWLDLLESDEFVKFHLSRSAAAAVAAVTWEENSRRCTFFELEDEIDVESSHVHHLKHLTEFDFPHRVKIEGSANGMLLLLKSDGNFEALFVCNPISREYVELHRPEEIFILESPACYGFGVSKISGQYKVVRIIPHSDFHVYTLGTGSWRGVEPPRASFSYESRCSNAFVNGNLHWLVMDSNGTWFISCFDLETECFSTFSVPPLEIGSLDYYVSLSALRDCLCLCDKSSEGETIIWMMKEYGDEKSWTREYVINIIPNFGRHGRSRVYPIKVFKDGDILFEWSNQLVCYYSNKTKTIQQISVVLVGKAFTNSMLLTPSFLSLKSFGMENVISL